MNDIHIKETSNNDRAVIAFKTRFSFLLLYREMQLFKTFIGTGTAALLGVVRRVSRGEVLCIDK